MQDGKKGTPGAHPREEFSCAVVGEPSDDLERRLRKAVAELRGQREWSIRAPEIVRLQPRNEEDLEALGVVLEIHSALPRWHQQPSASTGRAQLDEVRTLVAALLAVSAATGDEFLCYLGDGYVGSIANGHADHLLRDGLLGEWKKRISPYSH